MLLQVPPPDNVSEIYDILFYETEWYRPVIEHHPRKRRAFGINTNIYKPGPQPPAELRFDGLLRCKFTVLMDCLQGMIMSLLGTFCPGSVLGQYCKSAAAGWRLAKFTTISKRRCRWLRILRKKESQCRPWFLHTSLQIYTGQTCSRSHQRFSRSNLCLCI